jgi:hypothetical protein
MPGSLDAAAVSAALVYFLIVRTAALHKVDYDSRPVASTGIFIFTTGEKPQTLPQVSQ